ncbi:VanZ family protein [Bacteroides sp. 224]|uniref:VanZ family protein n=1 Tax=Bacteroides sp. 224 TaxID=2302936 RepID=UPI0013D40E9F|nr:VanZ family protein [Bacteroides sp. 224]NDV66299.1 VanZ family protein [Bacteroides sp. 224]
MLYYFRKYPLSISIILLVIYLSFFRPPKIDVADDIPNLDKIAHFCMYFGLSGMLWWEFLRSHKNNHPMRHAWIGACLLPILFSGAIELLQEYCTAYRGGDWMDFVANATGALCAALVGYYILKPKMLKKKITD